MCDRGASLGADALRSLRALLPRHQRATRELGGSSPLAGLPRLPAGLGLAALVRATGGVPLLAAHGVERAVHPLDHVEGVRGLSFCALAWENGSLFPHVPTGRYGGAPGGTGIIGPCGNDSRFGSTEG